MSLKDQNIGETFGCYKVIDTAQPSKTPGGQIKHNYLCECVRCGNRKIINKYKVTHMNYQYCENCKPAAPLKDDLVGRIFGNLKVIERIANHKQPSGKEKVMYLCQCKCGTKVAVSASHLKSNHTTSCGCLQKYKASKQRSVNLIGKKFGLLKVVDNLGIGANQKNYWKCECECGNIKITYTSELTSGKCKSCGCLCSVAEHELKNFMIANHINFIPQYTFDDCVDKRKLPFDFGVIYNNQLIMLIELQGQQHYRPHSFNNENDDIQKQNFLNRIRKDDIKQKYCSIHHIPLLCIRYDEFSRKEEIFLEYYNKIIRSFKDGNI